MLVGIGPERPSTGVAAVRERPVWIDVGAIERVRPEVGAAVALGLFEDVSLVADLARVHERPRGWEGPGATWTGTLPEVGGWFVLTLHRGVVMANFWLDDGRAFQVRTLADGTALAEQLDPGRFLPCAGSMVAGDGAGPAAAPRGGPCGPDDGSITDVMVVYTPQARTAAGGTAQIEALAANAIAITNEAYENSEIHFRVRLVHVAPVSYTEVDFGTDLVRLTDPSDGAMDAVHDWRDEHGADLVALLTTRTDACGVGWLLQNNSRFEEEWGFSVSNYACAVGNFTFPHELGHNQGACHAPGDGGGCITGGLYSYSVGYRFFGDSGWLWRTVMAYEPGTRIRHFSNPQVSHDGQPTGQVGQADNALTLNQTACEVSNFRPTTLPCPPRPADPVVVSVDCNEATIAMAGDPPPGSTWYWQGTECGTRTDLGSGPTLEVAEWGTYYVRAWSDTSECWSGDCGAVAVLGPTPEWAPLPVAGPTPRNAHAMAYDAARGVVVLFGGWDWSAQRASDETWEWDGAAWTRRDVPGPSARVSHAMAYDAARQRVVLFGGFGDGLHMGDTWEWDGSSWTARPVSGPGPRSGHAMAYDAARERVVLFGGAGHTDTWEWDGSSWSRRTLVGPPARTRHAMAYDEGRGVVVLFGGAGVDDYLGDTWEWDGFSWTRRSATGPTRAGHAMVYDPVGEAVVLFGGWLNSSLGDTWAWNGTLWARRTDEGPAARESHAMAYDAAEERIVLFGGYDDGAFVGFDDTWELTNGECGCLADFDLDGELNTADFTAFRGAFLAGDDRADVNGDGEMTPADFTAFRAAFLAGCG